MIVGDLIGSGEAQERGIVGETPNLAARLQGLAEPNSVIVAEATHELLGGLFEFKDLGPQDLKGFTARVRAWVALRPAVVESRFDALHGAGLTPLVGREGNPRYCFAAGKAQLPERAKSCCWQENRALGSRGSQQRCSSGLQPDPTPACAISAHRSTWTALSTRSSANWNEPPASGTTMMRNRDWISSMPCSRDLQPRLRIPRLLPNCCRCLPARAIPS